MKHPGTFLVSEERVKEWQQHHTPDLAGFFRGWIPERYFDAGSPRVLYVGKATSGDFDEPEVHSDAFNGSYRFWDFARKIARELRQNETTLSCVAWSNISKLSKRQVTADSTLLDGLEDLAVGTLEDEIIRCAPDVIVFVSHHFSDNVVKRVLGSEDESNWNRSENELTGPATDDIWWGRRHDGRRVLWMNHPNFKTDQRLIYAAKKVAYLVALG